MGIIIETKIDQYYKDQYKNNKERLLIENPLKMSEGTKISVNNYDYQFIIIYLDEELKIKAFNHWLQGLTIKNDTYPYCIIYFRRVDNQAMDINEFADIGFEISDAENNEYDLHVNNTNVENNLFSIGGGYYKETKSI